MYHFFTRIFIYAFFLRRGEGTRKISWIDWILFVWIKRFEVWELGD